MWIHLARDQKIVQRTMPWEAPVTSTCLPASKSLPICVTGGDPHV